MTEALAERSVAPGNSSSTETSRIPLLEISKQVEGTWKGNPPQTVENVVIDSRECKQASLFVALEGDNTDGHHFLDDAKEREATAVIVEEEQPSDLPQFIVPDSRKALQHLARVHRRRQDELFVIGVTGSCGKTTVKEMISHLIEPKYETGKTPGNYNNQLGLPLTLLNESHGDVLVAELGMNQPGEIEQLTDWAEPSLGVVTHIGPEHIEGLESLENIIEENGELLAGLSSEGIAVLPGWVEGFKRLSEKSAVPPKVLDKSVEANYPIDWNETTTGVDMRVGVNQYELRFFGDHLVKDAAIAAVVAIELGVPERIITKRLSTFQPLEGRGRVIEQDGTKVLDDGYNANPSSFKASLKRFSRMPGPRLALVGDMKELGQEASEYHRQLGKQLSAVNDLTVLYVGEYGEEVSESFESPDRIKTFLEVEDLPSVDIHEYGSILVKASNSVGLNKVLNRWVDES